MRAWVLTKIILKLSNKLIKKVKVNNGVRQQDNENITSNNLGLFLFHMASCKETCWKEMVKSYKNNYRIFIPGSMFQLPMLWVSGLNFCHMFILFIYLIIVIIIIYSQLIYILHVKIKIYKLISHILII